MSFYKLMVISLGSVLSLSSHAFDARSVAMGNTGVSAGIGVNGAMSNPALLMKQKRADEFFHFRFGVTALATDPNESIKKVDDNQDLVDELDADVEALNNSAVNEDCFTDATVACITGTKNVAELSNGVLSLLNDLDEEPVDINGQFDLGFAMPRLDMPLALNASVKGSVSFVPDLSNNDSEILEGYIDVLIDDQVTSQEVNDNANITQVGNEIEFDLPDDEFDSTAEGGIIVRTQVSLALAKTFEIKGHAIDFGITPKFSRLRAGDIVQSVNDDTDDEDFDDQLEASEVTENSITLDIGVMLKDSVREGVSYGAVIRNLIPESITTNNGYEFETTPQFIASALFDKGWYQLTADAALNKAKVDNLESQNIGLGAELEWKFLQFRLGVAHDLAIEIGSKTQFSAGLGLGFIDLGASYNGESSGELGAQIAFGF